MTDDRPIKAHLDEEMRAHIEFVLNRNINELEAMMARMQHSKSALIDEHRLARKCLKEIQEAGT